MIVGPGVSFLSFRSNEHVISSYILLFLRFVSSEYQMKHVLVLLLLSGRLEYAFHPTNHLNGKSLIASACMSFEQKKRKEKKKKEKGVNISILKS